MVVKVGDEIPAVELFEGPGNKVDLAKELASGQGVIVGVPAAFSPGCTASHVPGYINHKKLKDHKVFVIAVNDPFVMQGWQETIEPGTKSGIRFLADPTGEYGKKVDLLFDPPPVFADKRLTRHAIVTENGKVKSVHIEPDTTKVKESAAEVVLGA